MPEYITINDKPVEVPAKTISEGRAAVQQFHREQLEKQKLPFTVFDGDPVELPAHLAGKSKKDIDAWIADETERRADPVGYAARKAQQAPTPTADTPPATVNNPSKE
ncbi:MAG TPA: hypothetical protein VIP11_22030 [Gemmatimonadaceae bacterium]